MIRRREVNRYHNDGPDRNRQPPGERRSPLNSPDRNVTVDVQDNSVEINTPVAGFKASGDPTIEQPYLVPLGIPGIYQSPAEPVDPTDCERWPNSPYCGGTGVNLEDFRGLDVDVHVNPCEICVTVTPTLGFISLPPYTICKRSDSPECKLPGSPPPPEPGQIDPTDEQLMDYLGGFPAGCIATIQYACWSHIHEPDSVYSGPPAGRKTPQSDYRGNVIYSDLNAQHRIYDPPAPSGGILKAFYNLEDPYLSSPMYEVQVGVSYYRLRELLLWIKQQPTSYRYDPITGGYIPTGYAYAFAGLIVGCPGPDDQGKFDPRGPAIAPPYPPTCTPCNDMACCDSESEELLRLIARRLGTDQFPAKVPKSLLADRGNGTEKIESLTALTGWLIKQVDALVGQFPIEIEIEDTDPTKEGNQSKKLKLTNLAETLAELMGTLINTSINSDTLVNIGIRTLTEAGAAKNAAIVAQDVARANAEFLDYEQEEISRKIPCAFTPGKTELDEILQESEQTIRSYENVDKQQLKDYLTELLQMAAIIRAVHWRQLDHSQGNYKQQIKSLLKNLVDLSENDLSRSDDGKPVQTKPESDFDTFVEKAERGFIDESGIQDGQNPYQRPLEQRPRIREIGKDGADQDASRNP